MPTGCSELGPGVVSAMKSVLETGAFLEKSRVFTLLTGGSSPSVPPWSFTMCRRKLVNRLNPTPHQHLWDFSSLWTCRCLLSMFFTLNDAGHWSHWNSLESLCLKAMWVSRVFLAWNAAPQTSHMKLRLASKWRSTCRRRLLVSWAVKLQNWHWRGTAFSPWLFWCLCKACFLKQETQDYHSNTCCYICHKRKQSKYLK